MKNFWSYISNGKYSVGCTGQTVYVFDETGTECARFKDINYGYTPLISPNGKVLAVKSTEGKLAVYSLETLTLVKKFRFSNIDSSQDDGCCFTLDSKYFVNIERQKTELHNAVTWYNAETFDKICSFEMNGTDSIDEIEQNHDGQLFVIGYFRGKRKNQYFVGTIEKDGITASKSIEDSDWKYYKDLLSLKRMGFTRKACEWTHENYDFEEMKNGDYSLKKLFDRQK